MSHNLVKSNKLVDRALSLHKQERYADAEPLYKDAITAAPKNVRALYFYGLLKHQQGDNESAIGYLRRSSNLAPRDADIHYNLGVVAQAKSDVQFAEACYRKAIELNPNHVLAINNLGILYNLSSRFSEAEPLFQLLSRLDPDNLDAKANQCNSYLGMNQPERVIALCQETLKKDEWDSRFWFYLGDSYLRIGKISEAESALNQALKYDPRSIDTLCRLGELRRIQSNFPEAIEYFQRSIKLAPDNLSAHCGLGKTYFFMSDYDKALNYFLQLEHENRISDDVLNNISFLQLMKGHYRDGWKHYQSRRLDRRIGHKPPFPPLQPDLRGIKLLLTPEQGIGDQLFFLRFNRRLRERGAELFLSVHDKLVPLISRCNDIGTLIHTLDQIPKDAQIYALGDSPYLLNLDDANTITPSIQIPVDSEREISIKQKLANMGPPPYIGLSWRAGIFGVESLHKEISFDSIEQIVSNIDATWVVLQRNPHQSELEKIRQITGDRFFDASTYNDNLSDMLAILNSINSYITVSNTNLHLREAIGKSGHVLVPSPSEWRWGSFEKTSPWFPSWKIYRQSVNGSWDNAIKEIISAFSTTNE